MLRLLVVILVLLVAVGASGYWRGWYSLTEEGSVEVQVDQEKIEEDSEAFSKAVGEKATMIKDQVAGLWEKTEGLMGDDKAQAQKELGELEKQHDRLVQQIGELRDASPDRFESIKQDLSETLDDVEKKIEELTEKLDKEKDQ